MRDQEICNALKELAELKDQGYLTEEQYLTEVNALMASRDSDSTLELEPLVCETDVPELSPEKDPEQEYFGDPEDRLAHPPEEVVNEILDRESAPRKSFAGIIDDAPPQDLTPDYEQPLVPPGRVIVHGKVPWRDDSEDKVRIDTKKERGGEQQPDKKSIYENVILRERLATMARETNRKMNVRKNENMALLLNLILPGAGHLYMGMLGIGAALIFVAGILIVLQFMVEEPLWSVIIPVWILAGLLGYNHAQKYNFLLDRKRINKRRAGRGSGLSTSSAEKTTRRNSA